MIRTIFQKEIREHIHSFKFTSVFILLVVLITASMFIMYRDYRLRQENYEILRPESNQPIAIIPPTPLSIFVKGLDESMGRSFEIRFGGRINVGSRQQSINTLFRLFTTPDLLYVIKVIVALCAMLFSFDLISGEKESRSLSLTLSNSVKRSTLIIGKWLGGFSSLIIPFFTALLVGIVVVTLSPYVQFTAGDLGKLGMLLLSSIIYCAFFFSLGLFISCITKAPATSLIISLFAWALIVFIVPNLGNTLARQLMDIESVQQFEMKRSHIWIKERFEFIKGMGNDSPIISQGESVQNINSENDMILNDYLMRFGKLVTLSMNITRISPAASFTYLVTDIAGTGIYEENKLKEAVLRYKDMVWDKPLDSDGNLLGEFPQFSYTRSTIRGVLTTEGLLNLAVLVLFTLCMFSAAYVAFLMYDVR